MKKHPHFLRWAKHQGGECCICRWIDGQPGVEATDLHHYGASGMGMKGTDYDVCRVCRRHHGIIQGKSWKSLERAGRLDIWAAIVQDGDSLKRKYLGEIDTLHAKQEKLF